METTHYFYGHFPIAMLVYQRVAAETNVRLARLKKRITETLCFVEDYEELWLIATEFLRSGKIGHGMQLNRVSEHFLIHDDTSICCNSGKFVSTKASCPAALPNVAGRGNKSQPHLIPWPPTMTRQCQVATNSEEPNIKTQAIWGLMSLS